MNCARTFDPAVVLFPDLARVRTCGGVGGANVSTKQRTGRLTLPADQAERFPLDPENRQSPPPNGVEYHLHREVIREPCIAGRRTKSKTEVGGSRGIGRRRRSEHTRSPGAREDGKGVAVAHLRHTHHPTNPATSGIRPYDLQFDARADAPRVSIRRASEVVPHAAATGETIPAAAARRAVVRCADGGGRGGATERDRNRRRSL